MNLHLQPQPRTATLLCEYLASLPRARFDWRGNNCCHFAARWVQFATGVDPMAGLPETPSAAAALRLVRTLGGTLSGAWTARLGRAPIVTALAQVGDLVVVEAGLGTGWIAPNAGTGQAIGICAGRTVVVIDGDGACHHLAIELGLRAWRLFAEAQPDLRAGTADATDAAEASA